jgi:hypothetical protein
MINAFFMRICKISGLEMVFDVSWSLIFVSQISVSRNNRKFDNSSELVELSSVNKVSLV